MNRIVSAACELLENKETFVLATIVSHTGSTPRTSGSRMVVTGDRSQVDLPLPLRPGRVSVAGDGSKLLADLPVGGVQQGQGHATGRRSRQPVISG